jgi:hypothetical protein
VLLPACLPEQQQTPVGRQQISSRPPAPALSCALQPDFHYANFAFDIYDDLKLFMLDGVRGKVKAQLKVCLPAMLLDVCLGCVGANSSSWHGLVELQAVSV